MEREVGGGIGMGNTCKPMALSFQCMTKFITNKKKFFLKEEKKKESEKKKKKEMHHSKKSSEMRDKTFGLLSSKCCHQFSWVSLFNPPETQILQL